MATLVHVHRPCHLHCEIAAFDGALQIDLIELLPHHLWGLMSMQEHTSFQTLCPLILFLRTIYAPCPFVDFHGHTVQSWRMRIHAPYTQWTNELYPSSVSLSSLSYFRCLTEALQLYLQLSSCVSILHVSYAQKLGRSDHQQRYA